jgi:hypothetical protein
MREAMTSVRRVRIWRAAAAALMTMQVYSLRTANAKGQMTWAVPAPG